jgi:tetratricopeptide (TPR) repeat protein
MMLTFSNTHSQSPATVKESNKVFKTYPFSDPDPVPRMGNIYPYFRFDGYTNKGTDQSWKVVELENDYISVMILPEIGGKIWAATEKSTGKNFLYYNHVVKFRDIAMRGPWTSGGIEANYGIIGHTPNCATPVDYVVRKDLFDGSVSCFIGTLDLLTQTYWTLEIKLEMDKAYFTTRSFWSNTTPLEQPYYTWMNAGISAKGNLEFIYPGTHYLGHDGSYKTWPVHEGNGKNLSFYEQNNFGPYKSYHVFGKYTNFFGGFWHRDNFGMGRYAPHEDKAGKKIWIWGLSQQGMIWENLLSDTDGQYVEVQSGRLFNQTDHTSTATPFKHRGFLPYSTDVWTEHWFPVKGTQGFVTASPAGAMNVRVRGGRARIDISPLEARKDKLVVRQGDRVVYDKVVDLSVLKPFADSVSVGDTGPVTVTLGDKLLEYTTDPANGVLSRPVEPAENFDWNSVQGLHLEGKEFIRERQYVKAEEKLRQCLAKDPNYLPALTDLAMVSYRNLDYAEAMALLRRALRVDTYDPAANFYYGLTSLELNKKTDARDGFDMAAMDPRFRGASYTEMSRLALREGQYETAIDYAESALKDNQVNVEAMQLLAVAHRRRTHLSGELPDAGRDSLWISRLKFINPLNHFAYFESYLLRGTPGAQKTFTSGIRNELPVETYLELAAWYYRVGLLSDAKKVLALAPANAEVLFWLAFLEQKSSSSYEKALARAIDASASGVFPFRAESTEVFAWATSVTNNWKPKYFLGLIYWSRNQLSKARELFAACGNRPEFAPLYAARTELIKESALQDLQKAAELDPGQWRYGKMIIQYHVQQRKYPEALAVAQDYDKRIPNDFRIRLLLAKAWLLNGNYTACDETLAKTQVLPYEGSTEGHALYREAWLMQAIGKMKARKFTEALAMISKARLYPANLGVGKPYEENIDSRVEYYLEGICQEGLKKSDKAAAAWTAVTSQSHPAGLNTLVAAWALRKQGKSTEGERLLKDWAAKSPGPLTQWCLDVFEGKAAAWDFGTDADGSRVVEEMVTLVR